MIPTSLALGGFIAGFGVGTAIARSLIFRLWTDRAKMQEAVWELEEEVSSLQSQLNLANMQLYPLSTSRA